MVLNETLKRSGSCVCISRVFMALFRLQSADSSPFFNPESAESEPQSEVYGGPEQTSILTFYSLLTNPTISCWVCFNFSSLRSVSLSWRPGVEGWFSDYRSRTVTGNGWAGHERWGQVSADGLGVSAAVTNLKKRSVSIWIWKHELNPHCGLESLKKINLCFRGKKKWSNISGTYSEREDD